MRELPDFQMELKQTVEFIMSSKLAKRAFEKPPFADFSNIVREIIEDIDRLSKNCHMAEFTAYSLPHICSLVERISDWGNDGWLKKLESKEAGYLLLATLVHDMGMLSQTPEDLDENQSHQFCKGMADVVTWIRKTHIHRLEGLLNRLTKDNGRCLKKIIKKDHFKIIITMANAHHSWPWQPEFELIETIVNSTATKSRKKPIIDPKCARGLAAVIAVAELLDEVNNSYDRSAFMNSHQETLSNKAHWLKSCLTANGVEISKRTIKIDFVKPTGSGNELGEIYKTLRNHYRLVRLYNRELGAVDAEIDTIVFEPLLGIPKKEWPYAVTWEKVTKDWVLCPSEQLLNTFMPEARDEISDEKKEYFKGIGLEKLDLTNYKQFIKKKDLLTEEEMIFLKLYNYEV